MKFSVLRLLPRTALAVLCACLLAGCQKNLESTLRPPETPILTGGLGWALVTGSYVRLKEGPSARAADIDHLRRHSVFEIESRVRGSASIAEDKGLWYGIKAEGGSGWVREADVEIYRGREQAEHAAASSP